MKHLEAAGEDGRVRGGRKKTVVALGVWRGKMEVEEATEMTVDAMVAKISSATNEWLK